MYKSRKKNKGKPFDPGRLPAYAGRYENHHQPQPTRTMKHKWISNEAQPGVQTDIGLWHTLPPPDLAVQVMRAGYEARVLPSL